MAKLRVNICLDKELDDRIAAVSKLMGISKSELISIATTEYMDAIAKVPQVQEQLSELQTLLGQLGKIKK